MFKDKKFLNNLAMLLLLGTLGFALYGLGIQHDIINAQKNTIDNYRMHLSHEKAVDFIENGNRTNVRGSYYRGSGFFTIKVEGLSFDRTMEYCAHEYFHYLDDTRYIDEDHWHSK